MTEIVQQKVNKQELRELYAKAYAYKEAQKQLDSPELADGYLRYLASSPEDLVKIKVAYSQMYPNESQGNKAIDKELKRSLSLNPLAMFGPLKKVLLKIASLYGRAFNEFLEKLAMDEDWFYDYEKEDKPKPRTEQTIIREQTNKPQERDGFGVTINRARNSFMPERTVFPNYRQMPNEPDPITKKKRKKLFGRKGSVERVAIQEIAAERAKERKLNMPSYDRDAARLEAYNASVKARAEANRARESFASQMTNMSQMAPQQMSGMMMGR